MKKLFFVFLLIIPHVANATEPPVLINEVAWMGTEISANAEWLELKNNTGSDIDLTGWRLEADDGTPKINLVGNLPAAGFFILERTSDDTLPQITADQIYTGALSNSGEGLKLYDNQNNIIDQINATGGWPGGNNAIKQTMERTDSGGWQSSFDPGGTPKTANSTNPTDPNQNDESTSTTTPEITSNQPTGGAKTATPPAPKKGDIIFNEVLVNPIGIDNNDEFIEIKNVSQSTINLSGWKISNSAKQIFLLPTADLAPNTITFFGRPESKLALNNDKENLTLYAQDKIIDQLKISLSAEGKSYSRADGSRWEWTDQLSPGQENPLPKNNEVPTAVAYGPKTGATGEILNFDASDSCVANNDPLAYLWQFSDGRTDQRINPKMVFPHPGKYEATLIVSSSIASSTDLIKFEIIGPAAESAADTTTPALATTAAEIPGLIADVIIPNVFISEFLPDPVDSETENEFIEIFNNDSQTLNLGGWQIDDADGGSRPYTIPQNTIIKPGQYLAFYRRQTKIALNNDADAVQLINPNRTVVDYTEYEETKPGSSFVLAENFSWQQSDTPTPGEINILPAEEPTATTTPDLTSPATSTSATATQPKVLGVSTVETPTQKPIKKYIIAGGSALLVIGLIAFRQIKKFQA